MMMSLYYIVYICALLRQGSVLMPFFIYSLLTGLITVKSNPESAVCVVGSNALQGVHFRVRSTLFRVGVAL